jgi:transglutaminase-like putative cysteine protease
VPQDTLAKTGLSGSLRMGGIAELAIDDSIAFRVRFTGAAPLPAQMYWRGPVLSDFDGREWTRLASSVPAALRPRLDLELQGARLRYEMTLEPSRLPLLPLLEMTPDDGDAAPRIEGWLLTLRPDAQWQLDRPLAERVRVQAAAWLEHRHGPRAAVPGLRDLVRLPPGYNPRMQQWAAELRAQAGGAGADARTLAQALLRHIRSGDYTYTLEPGEYGRDAIDEFWFDRRLGFCEHYATAFVVAMRALDVPARVVTGYQGADPDPQDGWWIVRQRHAHAWAEYWEAGTGWVRIDPTSAVAPERVQRSFSLRPPPGLIGGAIGTIDPALAQRLRDAWERIDNRWNQWVLNYSRGQQFDLLRELGFAAPSWQDLATLLIALLCTAALAGAGWAWWDRRRQDPWQRLQRRVQQRLAALGVPVLPHQAPRTRAEQVRQVLGARGEDVAATLDALDRARYAEGRVALRGWWRRFDAATRDLA